MAFAHIYINNVILGKGLRPSERSLGRRTVKGKTANGYRLKNHKLIPVPNEALKLLLKEVSSTTAKEADSAQLLSFSSL